MVSRLIYKWECQSNKFRTGVMFIVLLITISLSGVLVGMSLTRVNYIEQMEMLKATHEKEVTALNKTIELLVDKLSEQSNYRYRMPYFGQSK
jgi:hypothetical protein